MICLNIDAFLPLLSFVILLLFAIYWYMRKGKYALAQWRLQQKKDASAQADRLQSLSETVRRLELENEEKIQEQYHQNTRYIQHEERKFQMLLYVLKESLAQKEQATLERLERDLEHEALRRHIDSMIKTVAEGLKNVTTHDTSTKTHLVDANKSFLDNQDSIVGQEVQFIARQKAQNASFALVTDATNDLGALRDTLRLM